MPRSIANICLGTALLCLMVSGCGGTTGPGHSATTPVRTELVISAAVSLKDVLTEIKAAYEDKNPRVKLIYNLGASGMLEKQIEQGAPADLFISAASRPMNDLEAKKLVIKESRRDLAENSLVLIVPQKSNNRIERFEDLNRKEISKFAIGEPSVVPAGQYAQQVLESLGIWESVREKAVQAKDVRAVLTYVETENVEAGIVYRTDSASSGRVKVAAVAPQGSHERILYPAAILASTRNPEASEEFLAYLFSEEAAKVFAKHGFTPLRSR